MEDTYIKEAMPRGVHIEGVSDEDDGCSHLLDFGTGVDIDVAVYAIVEFGTDFAVLSRL